MGKVDINILFSILDVLAASLVDNDLADECSQNLGRKLLDVRVLADYFKEAFHIGGRCRILSVSIWRYRAHTLATFGFRLDHGSYLLDGILCVPLIEKVHKRCKLISLVVAVSLV